MSRAKTADELRAEFLCQVRTYAAYWSSETMVPGKTVAERLDGLAFSLLNIFDGTTGMPAFDLVARPHPDDKAFLQAEEEDWVEDGTVINGNAAMHEEWCRKGTP